MEALHLCYFNMELAKLELNFKYTHTASKSISDKKKRINSVGFKRKGRYQAAQVSKVMM